jgi:hypothetical protein
VTNPGDLDPADQASLDDILASSPELALMAERRGRELDERMTVTAASGDPH